MLLLRSLRGLSLGRTSRDEKLDRSFACRPTDDFGADPEYDAHGGRRKRSTLAGFRFRFPSTTSLSSTGKRKTVRRSTLASANGSMTGGGGRTDEGANTLSSIPFRPRDVYESKTETPDAMSLQSTTGGISHQSCQSCGRLFGPGKRRKLVDGTCGHERCYECTFQSEDCQLCTSPARRKMSLAPADLSPCSNRSSAMGRESGFQSYMSIDGSVASGLRTKQALEEDSWSQCSSSSAISIMASSQQMTTSRFQRDLQRRSVCSLRSYVDRRSFCSRTSYGRRSTHVPSRIFGMTSIQEQNYSFEREGSNDGATVHLSSFLPNFENTDLFVGRRWLYREILEHFSSNLPTNAGFIVTGRPGTGKTGIIQQLIRKGPISCPYARDLASKVVAYHLSKMDTEDSCLISNFVHGLALQLYKAPMLSSYRRLVDSSRELKLAVSLDSCNSDPSSAFIEGIIKPLTALKSQGQLQLQTYFVVIVDGICEAEFYRSDHSETLSEFLESKLQMLPAWMKLICTVRSSMIDIVKRYPFHRLSLDNEGLDERLSKDGKDYVLARVRESSSILQNTTPTSWKYELSPQTVLADYLVQVSQGSFLYLKMVMDLIATGKLVVKSSNFNVIPQSISEIFQLKMNLQFSSQQSFSRVRDIFSICLASLRTMTLREIYDCLLSVISDDTSSQYAWEDFLRTYAEIDKFLPMREDETVGFFHSAFREWLAGKRSCDANKFGCDSRTGNAALAIQLSRKPGYLNEEETLDLAHHILKAQIFKNVSPANEKKLSVKELQAIWIAMASADVSQALSSSKNMANPNLVASKLLLVAKASPDSRVDKDGNNFSTPLLSQYIARGNEAMVGLLIDFGADISASDSRGYTPLMLACSQNRTSIIQLLVTRRPATLNQSCNDGSTALAFAARNGSVETLKFLLLQAWPSKGCCRELAVQGALLAAIKSAQLETLKLLLEDRDASVNTPCLLSHEMPLQAAIVAGKRETCELLLSLGADLSRVVYPLHLAVENGQWTIAEMLINSGGCDVSQRDKTGRTPLVIAAAKGEVAIVELLLSRGAHVNDDADSDGISPLSWACLKDKERTVQSLIAHGADVNLQDDSLRAPLHYATISGNGKTVSMLLEAKAGIETADKNGIRPIDQAISNASKDCVLQFLRRGAKLGPTTWAMAKEKPAILLQLLNKLLEDGNTLFRNGRFSEASYRYEYAIKRLPKCELRGGEALFLRLKAHLLLNLSRTQRKQCNYASAVERASQVLAFQPDSSEALWSRAKARYEMAVGDAASKGEEMFLEALADLREAIKIAPQNPQLHRFAIEVKSKMDQVDDTLT